MRQKVSIAIFLTVLLVGPTVAQQNERDPANQAPPQGWNLQMALGDLLAGPYDVETPPFDNRCLGVQEMDGYYFVTGRGHTTLGDNPQIHRFDLNGNYIDSFPQVSNSTGWRGRDMEAIGNTLYVGSDNGEVSIYDWDPVAQTLTHRQIVTVTGVIGTVRALCHNPNTNTFYTKSFTSTFYEFDMTWNVVYSATNTAVSAYGFGWDCTNNKIWSTTTGPSVIDVNTDGSSGTTTFGPTWGTSQGGADVYVDSRNPGMLSMIILGQGAPDSIELYDLAVPDCSGGGFTLSATGTCPGAMTFSVSGGTPGGLIAFLYGPPGSFTWMGSPCTGTTVDIASPTIAQLSTATTASGNAPGAVCGRIRVQAVDVSSCTVSNFIDL